MIVADDVEAAIKRLEMAASALVDVPQSSSLAREFTRELAGDIRAVLGALADARRGKTE